MKCFLFYFMMFAQGGQDELMCDLTLTACSCTGGGINLVRLQCPHSLRPCLHPSHHLSSINCHPSDDHQCH